MRTIRSRIALWAFGDDPPYSLPHLAGTLARPTFVPYLGRKSCPLALPLKPQVLRAESLRQVLEKALFPEIDNLKGGETVEIYWEEPCESGFEAAHVFRRRDQVLSRRRRQFRDREERHVLLGVEEQNRE